MVTKRMLQKEDAEVKALLRAVAVEALSLCEQQAMREENHRISEEVPDPMLVDDRWELMKEKMGKIVHRMSEAIEIIEACDNDAMAMTSHLIPHARHYLRKEETSHVRIKSVNQVLAKG